MRLKTLALVATSVALAGVFVSLGFWQIRRLHEKQRYNASVASRRFLPPVAFDSIPSDTAKSKLLRVKLEGRYDYANQIVWTLRGRDGSPGVHILTPLRRAGKDTAILVNRGWVYSPDATHAELARWREPDSLSGEGYVLPLTAGDDTGAYVPATRAFRSLNRKVLARAFPYPIAPVFAVLNTVPADSTAVPPRVSLIPLDEGSHRTYAFQWFSFAVISIIGAGILTRKT